MGVGLSQLGKYLRVQLSDHMIGLCLALWETAKLTSKVVISFALPPMMNESSCSSKASSVLDIFSF